VSAPDYRALVAEALRGVAARLGPEGAAYVERAAVAHEATVAQIREAIIARGMAVGMAKAAGAPRTRYGWDLRLPRKWRLRLFRYDRHSQLQDFVDGVRAGYAQAKREGGKA